MTKKIVLLFQVVLFSTLSFSQTQQEIDNVPINLQISHFSEANVKNILKRNIFFIGLKGHPTLYELKNYTDSINAILDSTKITLKSGTSWNPLKSPPKSKNVFFKALLNKVDSATSDRLNYLKFVSVYEKTGEFPYSMIDSLYFCNSYYNKIGERILKIEFISIPSSEEDKFILSERRVLFKDEQLLTQYLY
jgi:hypothetical protein